jgi:hypothetical protein
MYQGTTSVVPKNMAPAALSRGRALSNVKPISSRRPRLPLTDLECRE